MKYSKKVLAIKAWYLQGAPVHLLIRTFQNCSGTRFANVASLPPFHMPIVCYVLLIVAEDNLFVNKGAGNPLAGTRLLLLGLFNYVS